MSKYSKSIFASVVAVGAVLLLSSVVRADNLNFTLLLPVSGGAGSTISVTGAITAPNSNSGSVYLNSDSLSLAGPFTLDNTAFILNTPFSMAPDAI